MINFRLWISGCGVVLALATPRGGAAPVTIDASRPPAAAEPLAFAIGAVSPQGHPLSANSQYLTLDGKPWFPVLGEFHYSRYPAAEWEGELRKMKAGGVTVVSTYVFWIHHEESRGHFDWDDRRDLRGFVALCGRVGLKVWLRVGPWAHGEARNGGFPDWVVQSGVPLRGDDPRYLDWVRRLYREIGRQVAGEFWSEGGPIVGLQIENEYHPGKGGIEHMQALRRLALEAGLTAPYVSATGWDNAAVPTEGFLPVFGGYTEEFWSSSLGKLPPNQNFFFTAIRAEDNVMGDLSPKNRAYNTKYGDLPYLTAEMGGGMAVAYHRRPVMAADDSTAAAVVRVGSGANGLGFYMYHGGTNPNGRTTLEESQAAWNGYNDMEVKSYDFQAPLGEFGQVNPTYRTLKPLAFFLNDFGSRLAPLAAYFPSLRPADLEDRATPRVAVRSDGEHGFIFINNYQRNYPLGDKPEFQVRVALASGVLSVPRYPITLPDGAYPIWPFNLAIGGATLRFATAQLLCRLPDPDTLVFFASRGIEPQFEFAPLPGGVALAGGTGQVAHDGGRVIVRGILPGPAEAFRVLAGPGSRPVRVLVLKREDALNAWLAPLGGRRRLLLSKADLQFDGDSIIAASRRAASLSFDIFPAVAGAGPLWGAAGSAGVFQRFVAAAALTADAPTVQCQEIRAAGPARAVQLSAPPRHVAMEPGDEDFNRAAEWRVTLSHPLPNRRERAFLQIRYVGDVARIYAGNRLVDDNFYKGTAWEVGLWRFTPAELRSGLTLRILPLRRDAPIFLEDCARPDFRGRDEMLQLQRIDAVVEHQSAAIISAEH